MTLDGGPRPSDAERMIDGIETGYEPKFDFPARDEPPERTYLLATVPRSGSTFVSHLLWQTGCLGAPLEYCNFEPTGPYGHASALPAEQQRLWRAALSRRTSPSGVFGMKGFPPQFEALRHDNPALLRAAMRTLLPSRESARVVLLRRRDRTAHAISYARALLSGVWRAEQERAGRAEPEYSALAVERAGRLIEVQEQAWTAMLGELGIAALELWYEDAIADPQRTVARVANHVGVDLDPAAAVEVPRIERQSQAGARAWAEQHLR